MAAIAASKSVHKTLTSTTVDTVTFDTAWPIIEVINRDDTNPLWVTSSLTGTAPSDPTAAGDNTEVVLPGERVAVINSRSATKKAIIKILGNGDPYSVVGSTRG